MVIDWSQDDPFASGMELDASGVRSSCFAKEKRLGIEGLSRKRVAGQRE